MFGCLHQTTSGELQLRAAALTPVRLHRWAALFAGSSNPNSFFLFGGGGPTVSPRASRPEFVCGWLGWGEG